MTDLVRDLLDQAIVKRRKGQVKRMYSVLKGLQGQGSPNVTDASTAIDTLLYGEAGVWKGRHEQPL